MSEDWRAPRDQVDLEQTDQSGQQERVKFRRSWVGVLGLLALAVLLILGLYYGLPALLGSTTRVYRQAGTAWHEVTGLSGGPENIQVSPAGVVWVSTAFHGGLSRYDGQGWHYYSGSDWGSQANYLWSGFVLVGEEVWGATADEVVHFDGQRWTRYPEGLASDSPSAIAADAGEVWVVDRSGNLSHFDGQHWTIASLQGVLPGVAWPDDGHPTLILTPDRALWLAQDRLWRFDGQSWKEIRPEGRSLAGARLVAWAGDRLWLQEGHSLLWLSLDGAPSLDGAEWGRYRPADMGLASDAWIYDLAVSADSLWLATSQGLQVCDGDLWYSLPGPAGTVNDVAVAPDGTVWMIGTPARNALTVALLPLLLLALGGMVLLFLWMGRSTQKIFRQQQEAREVVRRAVPGLPAGSAPTSPPKITWKQAVLFLLSLIVIPLVVVVIFLPARDLLQRLLPEAPSWLPNGLLYALIIVLILVLPEIGKRLYSNWKAARDRSTELPAPPAAAAPAAPRKEELPSWLAAGAPATRKEEVPSWLAAGTTGAPGTPATRRPLGVEILGKLGLVALMAGFTFLIFKGIGGLISAVGNTVLALVLVPVLGLLLVLLVGILAVVAPTRWVENPARRSDYAAALRRVHFLRRLRPRDARFLFLEGTVLDWLGRPQEAEQLLRASMAEEQANDPGVRGNALANLGYALVGQGRYEEAIRAFEGSLEISAVQIGAYLGLAEAYLRQGVQPQRVLELLARSEANLQRSPFDRWLNGHLVSEIEADRAWAMALQGRHLDATEALERAFRKADRRHQLALSGLYYRAAQVQRLRGDSARAREDLARACQIDPGGQYGLLAAQALQKTEQGGS